MMFRALATMRCSAVGFGGESRVFCCSPAPDSHRRPTIAESDPRSITHDDGGWKITDRYFFEGAGVVSHLKIRKVLRGVRARQNSFAHAGHCGVIAPVRSHVQGSQPGAGLGRWGAPLDYGRE